jgi:PAS domain S-box-containing protein
MRKKVSSDYPLSEQSYITIFEQSPISIQVFAPDGRTIRVNKAYEKLWGVTFAQVREYNILRDKQLVKLGIMDLIKRAFHGETVVVPPIKYVPDDTIPDLTHVKYRYTSGIMYPVKDKSGKIREVVLMHQDISDQKNAEEETNYQKALFQAQMEATLDGVMIVSLDGKILTYNSSFARMWKLPKSILKKKDDELALSFVKKQLVDPDGFVKRVLYLYKHPDEMGHEDVYFKDGRIFDRYSVPVIGENNEQYGWAWYFRDVTFQRKAERSLADSEERYRNLVNLAPDVLYSVSADGRIISLSPKFEQLTGWKVRDWVGKTFGGIIHPEDLPLALANFQKSLKGISLAPYELRVKTKDGKYRYGEFRTEPYYKDGKVVGKIGIARDVTERRLMEEELRRSRDQLEVIFQGVTDGITVQDASGKLIFVNEAAAYASGYTSTQDMMKHPLAFLERFEVTDTELRPVSIYDLPGRRVIGGEKHSEMTLRYFDKKTNEERWAHVKARGIFGPQGELQFVINIIHDITESKRVEETLRASEQKFKQLADAMPQQVWTATPDGKLDYVNQKVIEYFQKSEKEMLGDGWKFGVHPDDLLPSEEAWKEALSQGSLYEVEFRLRRHDGQYFWHVARALPSFDTKKRIVKWYGTNTDITERVEMEKRKDEFISMASHELKTPVTTLNLHTQLLERQLQGQTDAKYSASLVRMKEQIDRLTNLINDLLDLSKITAGKLEYRDDLFDITDLVLETVNSLQSITSTHTILVEGRVRKKIRADKDRISQVIINLLTNAIKYSPHSKEVLVRLLEHKDRIDLKVIDTGIGIPSEHTKKIFERFYQVALPKEKTYPGLGIGLYICNQIIKRHGGEMAVESSLGRGSTFSFSLPYQ